MTILPPRRRWPLADCGLPCFRSNSTTGTTTFWISGNWNRHKEDTFSYRTILKVTANDRYQRQTPVTFDISGGRPGEPIGFAVTGYDWQQRGVLDQHLGKIAAAADWRPRDWHHLALTWTRAGGVRTFVDGEPLPQDGGLRVRPAAIMPKMISLGNTRAQSADMLMDEFLVFSQPLTPGQIGVLADPERGLAFLPPIEPTPEPDLEAVREAKVREWGLVETDQLRHCPSHRR